jgi:hypothetical protein
VKDQETARDERRGGDTPTDAENYYAQINPDIEKTFTHEQREAVRGIIKKLIRIPSKKIIDYRSTFWFIKPLYIVVFIGVDRRKKGRATPGDENLRALSFGLKAVIYSAQLLVFLMLLFLALYFVKCMLGIDIFPDKHLGDFFPWRK